MNNTSEDIMEMLEDESSLGLVFGENLFIGNEPTTPKNCVTIFDTPGMPISFGLTKEDNTYYRPSIQIRCRNIDYQAGLNLLRAITIYLHSIHNEVYGGSLYTVIQCMNEPALLDWDENQYARFITNFNIQRR
jgi:hypothetical protein